MSDKPTIYANCAAGCKWETVHKDDFMRSASHIKLHASDDGNFYLVGGKEYKIFAEKVDNEFTCAVIFSYSMAGETRAYTFAFTNADKYADSFVFRLLEASANDTTLTLVYEIAGIRYTETVEGAGFDLSACKLYVSSATEVLLYNAEAKIVFEGDGYLTEEKASETYLAKPSGTPAVSQFLLPIKRANGETGDLYIFNDGQHGLKSVSAGGTTILAIAQATETHIKEQWFTYGAITPAQLSYAVKVGVTANKITLTDEEKAAAMAWLGAVAKAPTPTGYAAVYAIDRQGNDTTVFYSPQISNWTLAQRGANGVLFVGTPAEDNHATTKKYVDDLVADLTARIADLESKVNG